MTWYKHACLLGGGGYMYAEGLGTGCDIGSSMWVWIIDHVLGQRLIIKGNYPVFLFFTKMPSL